MKSKERKTKFALLFTCYLLLTVLLPGASICVADDHRESGRHHESHEGKGWRGGFGGILGSGHDEGDETTGQIVAWSLAAANFTVALSVLIKGVKRFAPLAPEMQSSLSKFNTAQKRYLMRLHCFLNPLILLVAILHWTLSRCKSTALPEWGLLTMGVIVALGITLKFKLCPTAYLKNVYKVHTQPVLLLILISMLVIGHLSMD